MTRIAADENLDNDILRGLQRRFASLDVIRIQDTEIYQAEDAVVLAWTAREHRVLLTHDRRTMPDAFYRRLADNLPVPGVLIASADPADIGAVIDDLTLLISVDDPSEWEGKIKYLPFR
ncbi:MAG: DUF5615 family PIN-like protein [Anaerolineae bacterium]|nr:DUF5615 family PIN-like protein [Anaerolineae bacterium]